MNKDKNNIFNEVKTFGPPCSSSLGEEVPSLCLEAGGVTLHRHWAVGPTRAMTLSSMEQDLSEPPTPTTTLPHPPGLLGAASAGIFLPESDADSGLWGWHHSHLGHGKPRLLAWSCFSPGHSSQAYSVLSSRSCLLNRSYQVSRHFWCPTPSHVWKTLEPVPQDGQGPGGSLHKYHPTTPNSNDHTLPSKTFLSLLGGEFWSLKWRLYQRKCGLTLNTCIPSNNWQRILLYYYYYY